MAFLRVPRWLLPKFYSPSIFSSARKRHSYNYLERFEQDPDAHHEWAKLWNLAHTRSLNVHKLSISPKGYLTRTAENLPWTNVPKFTGTVNYQKEALAFKYALDTYMLRTESCRRPIFWVDGTVSGEHAAAAVAFRKDPRSLGSDWIIKTYGVYKALESDKAETLAILQALQYAVTLVWPDSNEQRVVTVFSDSRATLEKTEAYEASEEKRSPLAEEVLVATKTLTDQGVRVELHWVPGHERVPGNTLADIVAKRAVKGIAKEQKTDDADIIVTVPGDGKACGTP